MGFISRFVQGVRDNYLAFWADLNDAWGHLRAAPMTLEEHVQVRTEEGKVRVLLPGTEIWVD